MQTHLHVLTKPQDALAAEVIRRQQGENSVKVVDLTKPDPDYASLVEEVFKADSVHVW